MKRSNDLLLRKAHVQPQSDPCAECMAREEQRKLSKSKDSKSDGSTTSAKGGLAHLQLVTVLLEELLTLHRYSSASISSFPSSSISHTAAGAAGHENNNDSRLRLIKALPSVTALLPLVAVQPSPTQFTFLSFVLLCISWIEEVDPHHTLSATCRRIGVCVLQRKEGSFLLCEDVAVRVVSALTLLRTVSQGEGCSKCVCLHSSDSTHPQYRKYDCIFN